MNPYRGITYPKIFANRLVWWLWRKFMCPREKHLLDECWSGENWYLSCDACGLEIHIAKIDETYCEQKNTGLPAEDMLKYRLKGTKNGNLTSMGNA